MSITSYRPRSLSRKPEKKLRDARLVVIAAEDTYAAKQYFDSDLFQSNRIKIEVLETPNTGAKTSRTHSSPEAVEKRLRDYVEKYDLHEDDNLCIMVDRDRWKDKMLWDASIHSVSSQKIERMLRSELGAYNKTNLDIKKFCGRVLVACERARKMDEKPTD